MTPVNWTRILATTDFSPFADRAVSYAHALAEKFSAELHVLHVVSDVSEGVAEHGLAGVLDPKGVDDAGVGWLAGLLGEAGTVRRVEAVWVGRDVAEKITEYARDKNMDIIVMATHGRTGLAHFWLGSIVEKVIRSAPCPVLAIRPTADQTATRPEP
jgi:universal stress protein A